MIEYRTRHAANVNDGFSSILRETADFFANKRVSIVGTGIEEVISEQSLFSTYVDKLSEGLEADEAEQMSQLLHNTRTQIMENASIAGIQPLSSLAMPTVRKMWVKVALKNALPTEPVKVPKFSISYMEPYMFDKTGRKVALPEALRNPDNNEAEKTPLTKEPIALPAEGHDLIAEVGGSIAIGDTIDSVFFVQTVTLVTGAGEEVVNTSEPLDIKDNAMFEVKASDGTTDTLFLTVDRQTGILNARSLKDKIKDITVKGFLSSENNERAMSVSFDIKTKDITVPVGTHINAPLQIEWLQDTMAMYNIDGAVEVVDIMSSITQQKLDQEILQFLDDSFQRAGRPYTAEFNVRPSASYSGSPKEWREELKTVIDHVAIRMKNDSAFGAGTFVIIGNPLDMHLIPNADWTFRSANSDRGGVEVEFDLGAVSGAANYRLVSSVQVGAGKLRMLFIPNSPKQMTYKYFPYTFNVEKDYIDGNRSLVPSIMMTKRHVIEELTPLAAEIFVKNNDGRLPE
jgi:hypothetical protein